MFALHSKLEEPMKDNKEFFLKRWWNTYLERLAEEQKKGQQCIK